MTADYLRQCLFLYPDYPMYVEINGERKPLLSVEIDSELKQIILIGADRSDNRDLG